MLFSRKLFIMATASLSVLLSPLNATVQDDLQNTKSGDEVIVMLLKTLSPFSKYHPAKPAIYSACFTNCSKDHCEKSEKVKEACLTYCPADSTGRCN